MSTVQWLLIVKRGQTIGKRMTRSQIVRLDGSAAGLVHGVVLRGIVPLFMLFVALGGLALVHVGTQGLVLGMFMGPVADAVFVLLPGKRALRDYVAGTEVIALAARAQSPSPAPLVVQAK